MKSAVIAKKQKMSLTTYSQIELGHRSARFEDLCGICHQLGITVGELEQLMRNEEK
jgi:transcriptional regulator with XRE-family HTH domain